MLSVYWGGMCFGDSLRLFCVFPRVLISKFYRSSFFFSQRVFGNELWTTSLGLDIRGVSAEFLVSLEGGNAVRFCIVSFL